MRDGAVFADKTSTWIASRSGYYEIRYRRSSRHGHENQSEYVLDALSI